MVHYKKGKKNCTTCDKILLNKYLRLMPIDYFFCSRNCLNKYKENE